MQVLNSHMQPYRYRIDFACACACASIYMSMDGMCVGLQLLIMYTNECTFLQYNAIL